MGLGDARTHLGGRAARSAISAQAREGQGSAEGAILIPNASAELKEATHRGSSPHHSKNGTISASQTTTPRAASPAPSASASTTDVSSTGTASHTEPIPQSGVLTIRVVEAKDLKLPSGVQLPASVQQAAQEAEAAGKNSRDSMQRRARWWLPYVRVYLQSHHALTCRLQLRGPRVRQKRGDHRWTRRHAQPTALDVQRLLVRHRTCSYSCDYADTSDTATSRVSQTSRSRRTCVLAQGRRHRTRTATCSLAASSSRLSLTPANRWTSGWSRARAMASSTSRSPSSPQRCASTTRESAESESQLIGRRMLHRTAR